MMLTNFLCLSDPFIKTFVSSYKAFLFKHALQETHLSFEHKKFSGRVRHRRDLYERGRLECKPRQRVFFQLN